VRTVVEVVAVAGPGGRTVLPVLRSAGALAARPTGPGCVHLVGTAAGPLDGDRTELRLTVGPGARLAVRSIAATVVLTGASTTATTLDVEGHLDLDLEPTVVTARAAHTATVLARLAGAGTLRLTERVVLGRTGEAPGRWTGTVRVERAGVPVLHTTQDLGPGGAGWAPPFTPRAYASELVLDGSAGTPEVGVDTVRLPLPGGRTTTTWGAELA
jgi:urease accessory protein